MEEEIYNIKIIREDKNKMVGGDGPLTAALPANIIPK